MSLEKAWNFIKPGQSPVNHENLRQNIKIRDFSTS